MVLALIMCVASSKSWSVRLAGFWGNIVAHRGIFQKGVPMKTGLLLI